MMKTLIMIAFILALGFCVIYAVMWLLKHAERLDDEDYQERRRVARELRDATEDLRYESEQEALRKKAASKGGKK